MAKVPFTKLKCKINEDTIPVQIGEETIAVKQYLPIQEKLALISRVIEYAHTQDANYFNPVKVEVIQDLEIIFTYTNISFTDKQKEDLPKLYDMLKSSGVLDDIIKAIPITEHESVCVGVDRSINSVYAYMNSIVGMIDTISKTQAEATFDVEALQQSLTSLQNSSMLKEIAPLLGLE